MRGGKPPEIEANNNSEISLADESLYPHLKITPEEFPRLLVTRKISDDGAEYFGAFLPATGVRFWLEFINRTFRLRTCQIQIDGKFPAPCPQFFNRRCLAPCVETLCDRESYLEMVEIVRLFLQNEREKFAEVLTKKIEKAAESLDYEKAAAWRDLLLETNRVFAAKDWNLWLDDAVDTFEIEEREEQIFVYLITQRGRKTLGKKVFVFENKTDKKEILAQVIWQFYKFHAPKEIRIPFDFPDRKMVAEKLSRGENRKVKFTVFGESNERATSLQALKRAKYHFDLRQIKPPVKTEDILRELKNLFNLSRQPQRVEAYDAAHISGTNLTAAKISWENGKFLNDKNEFWLMSETSEPESLRLAIGERFRSNKNSFPDLLLIDGGKTQMQAALEAVSFLKNREFKIVCAVKPPARHSEISHFIAEDEERVDFSSESEAMRLLLRLRDEAHDLANRIHRLRRESAHFYEPGAKPIIVPIRFDEPNGEAQDLQPLGYTKIANKKIKVNRVEKRQNSHS